MPHEIVFTALGVALILFLVLLVLIVLLISQAMEYRLGRSFRGAFIFAISIIGLCALIALGMVAAKAQRAKTFLTSFDRI